MPKKAAVAVLPSKIRIHDDFGQRWDVDPQDDLWPDVLKLTDNGTKDAVLPFGVIISNRGWGWWSCFKSQDEWVQGCGVPVPDHHVLDDVNETNLAASLVTFGGYVAFLEGQLGLLAGRRQALKEAYGAAVSIQTAQIEGGTEKAKEAQVLSGSETLRQTKRLFIEADMLYETAKGMCASYTKCWETVSRLITIRTSEMELTSGRHA